MKDIFLPADSDRVFIFIHGYTGSTDDFLDLPEIVHHEFNATVHVPLLPGHGTSVDNLLDLDCEDLLHDVEKQIETAVRKGKRVVLVGISLGAQATLYFASKYAVAGVMAIACTHTLRFPFNVPGLKLLKPFKRLWKKHFSARELELRAGTFYYDAMPADGLPISEILRLRVEDGASRIHQPVLFIHAEHEQLANPHSVRKLSRKISGKVESRFLKNKTHNVFFSDTKDTVVSEVVSFVKSARLFETLPSQEKSREQVSAVVPAHNEAPRIRAVLEALSKAPSIAEIIVIDDGSTDDTWAQAENFPKVVRLRNEQNKGKAACMDLGVQRARHDVIFFCDADLVGFKPEHAEAIIAPVVDGAYDMFIGMRGNFMQRGVKIWGLNSGERALRKNIWQATPDFYKHRFRIEAGLNYYVKEHTKRGFGWKQFDYSQPVKELKYGLLRGTLLRWWMNVDVASSYLKDSSWKRIMLWFLVLVVPIGLAVIFLI